MKKALARHQVLRNSVPAKACKSTVPEHKLQQKSLLKKAWGSTTQGRNASTKSVGKGLEKDFEKGFPDNPGSPKNTTSEGLDKHL